MTGASWFFVALARHAREHGGGELQSWLSEQEVTQRMYLSTWDAEPSPHPDGLGIWAEGDRDICFLLEYVTTRRATPGLTVGSTLDGGPDWADGAVTRDGGS